MPSGGWITGYSPDQNWRLNVLKKHDDDNNTSTNPNWSKIIAAVNAKGYSYQTSLYQTAYKLNNPVMCDACHRSNGLDAALDGLGLQNSGVAGVNALTRDMHTLHGGVTLPGSSTTLNNMTSPSNVGCYQCHPGQTTQCQRGAMTGTIPGSAAITCYGCHGNLTAVGSSSRQGWLDVPNCQMCHQNGTTYTSAFTSTGAYRTSTDTTFATTPNSPPAPVLGNAGPYSLYRYSTGHSNIECSACHGSQHAEYPTSQSNDNVYSINLQGYAGRITECRVCHGSTPPTTNNGGPHGMHTVGSAWVRAHPTYARSGGYKACAYCHGSDYKGTALSMILTSKTLAGKTFPAYHQMNCYDCHNGPADN
jgi:hypothetical protein